MKRANFTEFSRRKLEEVRELAESHFGQRISGVCLIWQDRHFLDDEAVKSLVEVTFVDENKIYPFVDLCVADRLDPSGRVIVEVHRSNYSPRPFGSNWTKTEGPYIIAMPRVER